MNKYLIVLFLMSSKAMAGSNSTLEILCTFSKAVTAQVQARDHLESQIKNGKIDQTQGMLRLNVINIDLKNKVSILPPHLAKFKKDNGRDYNPDVDCVNVVKPLEL